MTYAVFPHGAKVLVMTLRERLQRAYEYGAGTGAVTSMSNWCEEAAKVDGGGVTRGIITNLDVRLKTKPDASIGFSAIKTLADIVGVNALWVATGEGEMVGDPLAREPRGPFGANGPFGASGGPVAPGSPDYAKLVMSEAMVDDRVPHALREALAVYCQNPVDIHGHASAIQAMTEARFSGSEKLTPREWLDIISTESNRRRKGHSLLGHGARELEDDYR